MTLPYAEVIGDPIAHSKSPMIHKFWADLAGIEVDYRRFHVTSDKLADYVAGAAADPDWRGCNITIPHKLAIMDLVADPGNVRQTIGAMNTILRDARGELYGTNTDAAGFIAPIADLPLAGASVAVVGSGGAASAILFSLAKIGVGAVQLIARNPLRGAALLARYGLKGRVTAIDAPLDSVQLLVNASSLGMSGQPAYVPNLAALPEDAVVYDAVYAPLETPLLAAAARRGLATVDGLEMLIGQAALAFELFFDAAPSRDRDDELKLLLVDE